MPLLTAAEASASIDEINPDIVSSRNSIKGDNMEMVRNRLLISLMYEAVSVFPPEMTRIIETIVAEIVIVSIYCPISLNYDTPFIKHTILIKNNMQIVPVVARRIPKPNVKSLINVTCFPE